MRHRRCCISGKALQQRINIHLYNGGSNCVGLALVFFVLSFYHKLVPLWNDFAAKTL